MTQVRNNGLLKIEDWLAGIIYSLANATLASLNYLFTVPRKKSYPKTILVFRTGNFGDTLCAMPAYQALKGYFPQAQLLLLTSRDRVFNQKQTLTSLIGENTFNEIIYYEPRNLSSILGAWKLLRSIRSRRVDLLIYFGQYGVPFWRLLRDMFFFWIAGCGKLVGFKLNKHSIFRIAQRYCRKFDCETERLLKVLSPLGVIEKKPVFDLAITDPDRELIDRLWPPQGLIDNRPVIGISPGSAYSLKCWPQDNFISLAEELLFRYKAFIVLLAAEEQKQTCRLISDSLAGECLNLCAKTNFAQTAEAIKRCDLVVSCDSGPAHLAASIGVPVVIISSSWDYPNCWAPYGNKHLIIRHDLDCQVCLRPECPTCECIKGISIEEVIAACREKLLLN
jgi:heptosyltransferase-2